VAKDVGLGWFGVKEAKGSPHCFLQLPEEEEVEREVLISSP